MPARIDLGSLLGALIPLLQGRSKPTPQSAKRCGTLCGRWSASTTSSSWMAFAAISRCLRLLDLHFTHVFDFAFTSASSAIKTFDVTGSCPF